MPTSIDRFMSRARHSIIRAVVALTDRFPQDAPLQHAFLLRQLAAAIPGSLTGGSGGAADPDLVASCTSATSSLRLFLHHAWEAGHTTENDINPILERIEDIRRIAEHLRQRAGAMRAA